MSTLTKMVNRMIKLRGGVIKMNKDKKIENKESNSSLYNKGKIQNMISHVKKDIKQQDEAISIGLEYQIPEGEEFVCIITGFSSTDTGILMNITIFAEEKCNKTFYYKTNSSAIAQLRKFASMFDSFDGELGSIVGRCAIVVVLSTDYGFQYVRGVRAITDEEATDILLQSGFDDFSGVETESISDRLRNRQRLEFSEEEKEGGNLALDETEEENFEEEEEELDYDEEEEEEEDY